MFHRHRAGPREVAGCWRDRRPAAVMVQQADDASIYTVHQRVKCALTTLLSLPRYSPDGMIEEQCPVLHVHAQDS
jgi:hypothetical protein